MVRYLWMIHDPTVSIGLGRAPVPGAHFRLGAFWHNSPEDAVDSLTTAMNATARECRDDPYVESVTDPVRHPADGFAASVRFTVKPGDGPDVLVEGVVYQVVV